MTPERVTAAAVKAQKRRAARELLINGIITADEYALIEASLAPRTVGQRVAAKLPWVGYATLILATVAEILAQQRPELRGPLEQIVDLVRTIGNAL